MKSVYAAYSIDDWFGMSDKKDAKIRKIMENYDEEGSGSGFGQRDISFSVPNDDVKSVVSKLKKAKFTTEVIDNDD